MRFLTNFSIAMALPFFAPSTLPTIVETAYAQAPTVWQVCADPWVIDGDSLRCSNLGEIRLLGIDSPELHGCPSYRVCAPGNGQEAKRSMAAAVRSGPLTYRAITVDRYGRLVVEAWAGTVNLSCWQLAHGEAIYKPKWDNGSIIGRACPQFTFAR